MSWACLLLLRIASDIQNHDFLGLLLPLFFGSAQREISLILCAEVLGYFSSSRDFHSLPPSASFLPLPLLPQKLLIFSLQISNFSFNGGGIRWAFLLPKCSFSLPEAIPWGVGVSSEGVSTSTAVLCCPLVGADVNLCFLQVKELSVEQPGEHFLPLTGSWGGLVQEGLWEGGFALLLVQLGGVQAPPCSPPVPHMLLPSCMACRAGIRGMASSPGSAAVCWLPGWL